MNRIAYRFAMVALALGAALSCPVCHAVTIQLSFNSVFTDVPDFDPQLQRIKPVVKAAAKAWENILLDPWTLKIDYYYDALGDDTLADQQNQTVAPNGMPLESRIRFDTIVDGGERLWYFDESPQNHSEYSLAQTLYRDLSAMNQTSFFGGNVPAVLEEGFRGGATSEAPADAQNGTDLFSVAMHEIGHALGMTQNVAAGEAGDNDYDVDPGLVAGNSMDIAVAASDNRYHLAAADSVMQPNIGTGNRELPTATDVFAIAAAAGWSQLHLPRQDYWGGAVLDDPGNWEGGHLPDAFVDATVRRNNNVSPLTVATAGSMFFQNFTVAEGAWATTDFMFHVGQTTTIGGDAGAFGEAKIRLQSQGSLKTEDLNIAQNGSLTLSGGLLGALADVASKATISPSGSLLGSGVALVGKRFVNDGLVAAQGGDLTLTTFSPPSSAIWDLDGDGAGEVHAVDGDLTIIGTQYGTFGGSAVVGAGNRLRIGNTFVVDGGGQVTLNGSKADAAQFSLQDGILSGLVLADRQARIHVTDYVTYDGIDFFGNVELSVPDADDQLTLSGGDHIFAGGSYSGLGTLRQEANFVVDKNTSFDVTTFAWGNSTHAQVIDTTIRPAATMTVNSSSSGIAGNPYYGDFQLLDGTLAVNMEQFWTLPAPLVSDRRVIAPRGQLFFGGEEGGGLSQLRGAPILVGGLMQVNSGKGIVDAELATQPSAEINVLRNTEMRLQKETQFGGGTIQGGGLLSQHGDLRVVSLTSVDVATYDWDGDEANPSWTTVEQGTQFTINSLQIDNDAAHPGYGGHVRLQQGSALIVGAWSLDGTLSLEAATPSSPLALVDGADFTNRGVVQGNGQIQVMVGNEGMFRPGLSTGIIEVTADYLTSPLGSLEIELAAAGGVAGTDFDQLIVGGTAYLDGVLDVALIEDFQPAVGDVFEVLAAGSVVGEFASMLLPGGYLWDIDYGNQAVQLVVKELQMPGDYNSNGVVDGGDQVMWSQMLGKMGDGLAADGDGDGTVGGGDLLVWQAHFGSVASADLAGTPVPEPDSLLAILVGCVLSVGQRCRRQ